MPSAKCLPHRPEAENAVLGGILLGGKDKLAEALAFITEDDLYQPRAQAVFRAMRILDERGEAVDVVTLEAQLRKTGELELVGGIEGLARLDRYATPHNIKAHAELILESAQVRRIVVAAREIADEGMSEVEDPQEFLDRAERSVFAVRADSRSDAEHHVRDDMVSLFEDITARRKSAGDSGVTGIETPWQQLNGMTSGLQPTDLIILAARPAMGKSAFALNLAAHASVTPAKYVRIIEETARADFDGNMSAAYRALVEASSIPARVPTLVYSLEMGRRQLIERVLCGEARVDAQALKRGGADLLEPDFRALISAAGRMTNHGDLYIDDTSGLTITELRSRATRWASRTLAPVGSPGFDSKRRGLIIVDYLQLLSGQKGKKYGSREQEISEISRGLKALAKDLKLPVIALSQLNRTVDARADHRPQMSDLRESGAIEQDADVIMFLYREERYFNADTPEDKRREAEGKAELIIGKQRSGDIGTVPLTFIKKHTRFENPAPDAGGWE